MPISQWMVLQFTSFSKVKSYCKNDKWFATPSLKSLFLMAFVYEKSRDRWGPLVKRSPTVPSKPLGTGRLQDFLMFAALLFLTTVSKHWRQQFHAVSPTLQSQALQQVWQHQKRQNTLNSKSLTLQIHTQYTTYSVLKLCKILELLKCTNVNLCKQRQFCNNNT